MTNPYATIRAALESIRVCDDMTGEREAALAALAELEKELAAAVAERDGLGDYRSEFEPIWDGLQDALEGERQINNYGLGESEVECVRRVLRERDILRARLAARAELGPALGLVEIREPTPEECERICTEYERLLMREGTCGGRDAFDAVRAVMWPKSEGS